VTSGIVGQVYLRSPPGPDLARLTPRASAIDNEYVFSIAMARKRSDDKRRRILQAAVKVFARKGYFAARVAEIAQRAGVADGTIYLYFRGKEDILVSLFDELMAEHVERARRCRRWRMLPPASA
jgi:hypothetical protein